MGALSRPYELSTISILILQSRKLKPTRVNSEVLSRFKNEDSMLLMELERQCAGRLIFRSDPSIHREAFAILNPANNNKPLFQINM